MSTSERTAVALCTGKDCRGSAGFEALHAALSGVSCVGTRCLDLCKGPVVVIDPRSNDALVLAKVRSPKQRRELRRMIASGGSPRDRLARRVVTGSRRRTALRRLTISLRRHG